MYMADKRDIKHVSIFLILSFSLINNKPLKTITFISISTIVPVFIIALTSGALGEELGWRGYVLHVFQKKYTPLISSLLVGLIWGLWHLPLMILSGYSEVELVFYMIAFMVAIVSTSVIITFFYNRSKNITVAMWIHFWFNFLLKVAVIDMLPLIIYTAIGYMFLATIIVFLNKNELIAKPLVRSEAILGKISGNQP